MTTTIVPASRGTFEVELDTQLIFSKLKEDRFPTWAELKPAFESKLGPPPHWR